MSGKPTRGKQTTLLQVRPATPTQPAASTSKDPAGEEELAAASLAAHTEVIKQDILSSLRKDLVDTLKTEVRNVLGSELASVRADINTVRSEIREYRESITSELTSLNAAVRGMEESLSTCTDDVTLLQNDVHRLNAIVENLQNKCEDLEARSRRNNIRLVGIPEDKICSTASIAALLQQAFSLKEAPRLDRAHRALFPAPGRGKPPRVIVARCHYFQDCANILRLAREKQRIKMDDAE